MSTATANFWSGGLGSFAFWGIAIPADNLKKFFIFFATSWDADKKITSRIMGAPLDAKYIPLRGVAKAVLRAEGISGFCT